ncbi:MAG TPA: cytidylate kinase-like family protein [Solirubrobacteraceae bacterium]
MALIVVTVSASFGAGGSRVAPVVAERLGVPFHDRAIPREVARRLAVPEEAAVEQEENPPRGVARWLSAMVSLGGGLPGGAVPPAPELLLDPVAYRRHADATLRGFAEGGGVLLGRAGAVALADWPGALHVRLDGPSAARLAAAKAWGRAEGENVESVMREADRAREGYVRHFYGRDARDPGLYHLVLDSTALGLGGAVQVIVAAAKARAAVLAETR